jgi:hypothetical protein
MIPVARMQTRVMDPFEVVITGAGAAGEALAQAPL